MRRQIGWCVICKSPAGELRFVERVEQLASAEAEESHSEHHQKRAAAARASTDVFRILSNALDVLPVSATILDWCAALRQLGESVGIEALCERATVEDVRAWTAAVRQLAAIARLDARLHVEPRKLSLGQLLQLVVDVGAHERQPATRDDGGRVPRVVGGCCRGP